MRKKDLARDVKYFGLVEMRWVISIALLLLISGATVCVALAAEIETASAGQDGRGKTSTSASDAETEKELTRIAQQLMDAVAIGDKAVWQKYVADDVIYTDENWKILTKKDLVDSLSPLPKGYSGTIKVTNVRSRILGEAAVLSWEALEEEVIFGQKLSPVYLVTDTYFKRNGQWQLVAEQITVRPQPRKPIQINPAKYRSFLGEYELSSGVTYVVTLEDGKLIGQRTGRGREELMPADENTFFRKDTVRGEKVFVRDSAGRVTSMLDRRENTDLVWKKIK